MFPDFRYSSKLSEIISNKLAMLLKVHTCILEVPGSNPERNTHPD